MTTLAAVLRLVETGRSLPADGGVTVLPAPSGRDAVVLGLTGHHVVAADVAPTWVRRQLPAGDLSAPLNPPFLTALGEQLGRAPDNLDLLLLAPARPGTPEVDLVEAGVGAVEHPRVSRARGHRDDVRIWCTEGGLATLGRGVAGRLEAAIEVDPTARCRGLGRRLAGALRHVAPAGSGIWAQVAPANVASLRAFLAAGYRPVGAEVLFCAAAAVNPQTRASDTGR